MTAVTVSPLAAIACPPWCGISQSQHLKEVHWEGRAVHWSNDRSGDGWDVRHATVTDIEGNPVDEPRLYVSTRGGLTPAGAEALALTLLACYEEAQD